MATENAKQQLLNYKLRDLQGRSDALSHEIENKTDLIRQLDLKMSRYSRANQNEFEESMQSRIQDLITENENLVRSLAEERRRTKQLEIKGLNDTSSIKDTDNTPSQNLLQELQELDVSGRFKDVEEEETKRVNKLATVDEEKDIALERELEHLRRMLHEEQNKKGKNRTYCGFCV